ncbi:MAG TPA: tyrosine-type recombinase/integrase [Actinomycetes bacterium]|nr:tyrosine-type recombinase/integrase [Actinomycetes bacterium]
MIRQRPDRDGLQVQVYAGRDPLTGRKRWVSRQVPGKGRAAMKQARQVEAELLAQIATGQHRGSKTKTVAELIERWLEWRLSVRPISPTTVAAYRGYIDRSILPSLGRLQVGQLDAATLDTFYARLRRQGGKGGRPLAASSVRQIHAILSGALTRAVVWGWISHNPARLASPPSREQADTQPPAVIDAARLLRTAAAEDEELGLFLRLAVVLGARRGELCALRWSEVDLDQGEVLIAGAVVRVPREALLAKPTKTHAKRRVAIGAGTAELLRARRITQAKDALACGTSLAADAYVFSHVPDGSAPIDPDGITHRFQRLARRLGVRCRLHDLRHFMVTQLVAGGVDWRTVSGRAGHADGHMTLATYAHFQQAQDRQAAEFMESLLAPAARPDTR